MVPYILAKCLFARSSDALDNELDEAASIMDEPIASSSSGDEFLPKCQKFVAYLAMFRPLPSHPKDSEEAIYHACAFLSSPSVEDPLYPTWSKVLEDAKKKNRVKTSVQPMALKHHPAAIHYYPVYVDGKTSSLQKLFDGISNFSITDIERAIELGRSLSSNPSDLTSSCRFGQ